MLFTAPSVANNFEDANIVVQSLVGGERKTVQRGGYNGRYLPSGHLVYIHQGTLFAAPFNVERLEITAQPIPALENVASGPGIGSAHFAFSQNGSLVYLLGSSRSFDVSIAWMDRDGKTQPLRASAANANGIRFSPDGTRLAMDIADQQYDVWIYEWARDTLSRLTIDPGRDRNPIWTPDGRRVTFRSNRAGVDNLYWQRADGTGETQRLTESKNVQYPQSWHPSGKFLVFDEEQPQTDSDIMILPMDGDEAAGWKPGRPTVFLASPFAEGEGAFSPDGRWLAYASNESGRFEVYVRPFPGPGGKWQICSAGGENPTWSRNGKELFLRTANQKTMVATYAIQGDSFRADKPRLWSEGQFTNRGAFVRNFDLHPDGQRFAVLKAPETQVETKLDKVVLIQNFFDELRRIAPVKK